MKTFIFKRIRTRLMVWFLLAALTPLLITIVITYEQRVNVIESRTLDKLIAIRDLKVAQLLGWIEERSGDIYSLTKAYELNSLATLSSKDLIQPNNSKEIDSIRKVLKNTVTNYQAYSSLFIIDPLSGRVIISTNPLMEGRDKSHFDYFKKVKQSKELVIEGVYYSDVSLKYTMSFAAPIYCCKQDGQGITGILVAHIDLEDSLYPMLQNKVGLGKTGETLIVNSDVMALNELRWYEHAPLKLQIDALPAVYASQGRTGAAITTDYRGEEVLAAYTYIPETGWGFVSKQDIYELRAPIRDMVWNAIILFLISSMIISLIVLRLSKTLSEPIIAMDALAKKITIGDYSVRNEINSQDELGSLAISINAMVAEIQGWSSELNAKVKSRTEELEVKSAEMERFTYTVSHDLKSPLVTIKGFVGLLIKDAKDGNEKRMADDVKYISDATSSMELLLSELLEFSRIGRLDNPHEQILMNELVDEVSHLLHGTIMAGKISIDVQPQLPMIFADRPRLKEVIQNLLENAMKFMGEQPEPNINVGAYTQDNEVIYTIKDNGIGIAERYQDKIFGMFERLNSDIDGTGMGLALVKRIIETHGGRLWAESDGEGCGTTFFFTIAEQEDEL